MEASKTPAAIFGGLPHTLRMFRPTSRSGAGTNSKCQNSTTGYIMANTDSRVTIHMAASLGGFIARKDGRVDWLETSDEFAGGDTLDPDSSTRSSRRSTATS